MPGFDKIEFKPIKRAKKEDVTKADFKDVTAAPMPVRSMSAKKKKRRVNPKIFIIIFAVLAILAIAIGIPAYKTYKSALKTYREAKVLAAAVKTEDLNLASD